MRSVEIQMFEDPVEDFDHYLDQSGKLVAIVKETYFDGELPYAWDKVATSSSEKQIKASKAVDKFAFAVTRGIAK
jgi:hypothetical protein